MNEAEQHAYGLLAQALARHADSWARGWDFKWPKVSGPIYYHLSDSTFEGVAACLLELKIFRALDGGGGFIIDCEPDDAYRVAINNRELGPPFEELLRTTIDLFGDYGTAYWGFATQRHIPFGAGARLSPLFEALVPLGYVNRSEAGFLWTEQVAPIMRAAGYQVEWSE